MTGIFDRCVRMRGQMMPEGAFRPLQPRFARALPIAVASSTHEACFQRHFASNSIHGRVPDRRQSARAASDDRFPSEPDFGTACRCILQNTPSNAIRDEQTYGTGAPPGYYRGRAQSSPTGPLAVPIAVTLVACRWRHDDPFGAGEMLKRYTQQLVISTIHERPARRTANPNAVHRLVQPRLTPGYNGETQVIA